MGFLYLQMFLLELDNYWIQWKLYWLSISHDIYRGNGHYFIQIIGLKGVQPYAPFFSTPLILTNSSDTTPIQYELV